MQRATRRNDDYDTYQFLYVIYHIWSVVLHINHLHTYLVIQILGAVEFYITPTLAL